MQIGDYQWADDGVYAVWGNSADPACPLTQVMNCNNYQGLYSFHSGGGNELMGDGSVTFITDNIDLDTFISMYTRAAKTSHRYSLSATSGPYCRTIGGWLT